MITYKVTVDELGDVRWYNENDKLHRLDGPAFECPDGYKEWYIESIEYTEEQFLAKIESMNRPCNGKKVTVEGVEYTLA